MAAPVPVEIAVPVEETAIAAADVSPEDRLEAALPGLAGAVLRYTDDATAVATLIEAASPVLVSLLLPMERQEPYYDTEGELPNRLGAVDLLDAEVFLDGTVLYGTVRAKGIARTGAWIDLDTMGGPAPDLHLGVGKGWLRVAKIDNGVIGSTDALRGESVVKGDTVRFRVDLATTERIEPDHAGLATAFLISDDRRFIDPGPAGGIGTPEPQAVALLVHLAEAVDTTRDPDLALAIALNFGTFRGLVVPELVEQVEADAVDWFNYAGELDPWLAEQGATWSVSALSPTGKLLWAWPAAQNAVYGAFPLGSTVAKLSLERYRFLVPDIETLAAYRDRVTLAPSLADTANNIDGGIWDQLRYRANPETMRIFCTVHTISVEECAAWDKDQRAGFTLGGVDGLNVPMHEGTSASFQRGILSSYGQFIGDCSTATSLAMTTFQAVGIAPLAIGYTGVDLTNPTHDMPLYLDGDVFVATQRSPGRDWKMNDAYVYVTVPALDATRSLTWAMEPGAWARGPTIVGGKMTYGALANWLQNGIPAAEVLEWTDRAGLGEWPVP